MYFTAAPSYPQHSSIQHLLPLNYDPHSAFSLQIPILPYFPPYNQQESGSTPLSNRLKTSNTQPVPSEEMPANQSNSELERLKLRNQHLEGEINNLKKILETHSLLLNNAQEQITQILATNSLCYQKINDELSFFRQEFQASLGNVGHTITTLTQRYTAEIAKLDNKITASAQDALTRSTETCVSNFKTLQFNLESLYGTNLIKSHQFVSMSQIIKNPIDPPSITTGRENSSEEKNQQTVDQWIEDI